MNRYLHHFLKIKQRKNPDFPWKRIPAWSHIKTEQWYDSTWQWHNRITRVETLVELGWISPEQLAPLKNVCQTYPLLVSPYYLSLSEPLNPRDPIYRQAVPEPAELEGHSEHLPDDPFDENRLSPVPGLIHRYPDRALLIMSNTCTTFCRHCFRKRILGQPGVPTPFRYLPRILDYIKDHREIHDIILSGGDPLTLSAQQLRSIIEPLHALRHIHVIRIGSRVPVTLPMRLWDDAFLQMFREFKKLWVLTHFNHPRELTLESRYTVNLIRRCGVPVLNQAVLLKGINDNSRVMMHLHRRLVSARIIPYYLHHADPVRGTAHFRTSIETGLKLMEAMRGRLSGFAIPTYVVDLPRGGGKVPVTPAYLVRREKGRYIFKNSKNEYYEYPDEEAPNTTDGANDSPLSR